MFKVHLEYQDVFYQCPLLKVNSPRQGLNSNHNKGHERALGTRLSKFEKHRFVPDFQLLRCMTSPSEMYEKHVVVK